MTAQIPDKVYHGSSEYNLIGYKGDNLPTPQTYGIKPVMWSTACYRGYVATYAVQKSGLFLSSLHIGRLDTDSAWVAINGVEPETVYEEGYSVSAANPGERVMKRWEDGRIYNNLNLPTYFSGGILVGRVFIRELYVHMGFGKPYQYETVLELLFHEGHMVDLIDRSEQAAAWRARVIADHEAQQRRIDGYVGNEPLDKLNDRSEAPRDERLKGIEWRFSLDYSEWFGEY